MWEGSLVELLPLCCAALDARRLPLAGNSGVMPQRGHRQALKGLSERIYSRLG